MMENFADQYPDRHVRDGLLIALDGRGAFRRFKNTIRLLGVEEAWYAHKDMAMQNFARKWCKEHDIPWHLEEGNEKS
jgi:hypothetical protein